MILEEIQKAYRFYSEKMFGEAKDFNFPTKPDDSGGRYFEISSDGKIALLARDRGQESARKETYSVDEFMYYIFSGYALSRAFRNGPANRPFFENHKCAADDLGKLNPAWRERYIREHEYLFVGQNVKW